MLLVDPHSLVLPSSNIGELWKALLLCFAVAILVVVVVGWMCQVVTDVRGKSDMLLYTECVHLFLF